MTKGKPSGARKNPRRPKAAKFAKPRFVSISDAEVRKRAEARDLTTRMALLELKLETLRKQEVAIFNALDGSQQKLVLEFDEDEEEA